MAKMVRVTYLKAYGGHAAGSEGAEVEDDMPELMRQGIARWIDYAGDAPVPAAAPPPASEPPKP